MLASRAILIISSVLLPLLTAIPACALQSRIEDRSDTKAEGKEKPAKSKPAKRTVWNLDGGVFFATDGHLPNGSCFRLSGQMNAPDFFDGLRRVDSEEGTSYYLRNQLVTEYPDEVEIVIHLLDFPCTLDLKDTVVRPPITREMMATLRLNLFWKQGVHMRPVEESKRTAAEVRRIETFAAGPAADEELAPRYEWSYAFTIKSDGVPLTNDLVLVIAGADAKIAARVAARL
ncbi:MAG TPA: hypothetical protein VFN20_05345 [Candidatus Acidoferrum sp.]|nr:hypothetical protein [Candidatus Acidoferrum sp.]